MSAPVPPPSGKPKPTRPAWPPPPEPYTPVKKHPVYSVITALPVIMLMAGLYLFYRGEGAQSTGEPLYEQSIELDGNFSGLSAVQSGGDGRHYLWFATGERRRGPRVTRLQSQQLSALEIGDLITVHMAPHVEGSTTLWAWRVEHAGTAVYDESTD